MKTNLLKDLRAAIEQWAQDRNIEIIHLEVKYSGIGSNVHIRVVARHGFENWPRSDRENHLFDFLHAKINRNGNLFISSLIALTEEEYEQVEGAEIY